MLNLVTLAFLIAEIRVFIHSEEETDSMDLYKYTVLPATPLSIRYTHFQAYLVGKYFVCYL